MKSIDVKRSTVTLDPDRTHVLARPFRLMSDQRRSIKIPARVMALPENQVHTLLEAVLAEFGDRQLKIDEFLRRRFDAIRPYLLNGQKQSEERKLLLAAYLTHEYSLEAAALCNPSMVPHLDQSGVPPGSLRFILSLRATAEEHVSSIAFRSGILDVNSNISMDLPSRYSLEPMQVPNSTFEKPCSNGSSRNSVSWAISIGRFSTAYQTNLRWKNCAPASLAPQDSSRRASRAR